MGKIVRVVGALRLRPRTLSGQIALNTSAIVVVAGLLTIIAINAVLARALQAEQFTKGQSVVRTAGESLDNDLLDGDVLAVREVLDNVKATSPDIIYAFAFGSEGTPIIHTFSDGFPGDLVSANRVPPHQTESVRLLMTETGPVRDFAWRPLDGLPAEIHIGFSENQILATQRQVTVILAVLTIIGVLFGVGASVTFSRLVAHPIMQLAGYARLLGQGRFDETPAVHNNDEIGDLANAFAHMAREVNESMDRLRASEAGYRALIDAASEVGESIALIANSSRNEGTFLFVNDEFCRLTGYSRQRLLGASAAEIIHADSLSLVLANWRAIRSGEPAPHQEMVLVARDGKATTVETGGTLVDYQGHEALAWFARDITERKAREEEIRRRNRELAAVNAVAVAMSSPGDADHGLQLALERVLGALELTCGWIYVADREGSAPRLAASVGIAGTSLDSRLSPAFPDCACREVLNTGTAKIIDPREGCTVWGASTSDGQPLRCHGTVPLLAGKKVLGVLSVASTRPGGLEPSNFTLLEAVGRQIGVAMDNAWLWAELEGKERLRAELLARAIHVQEDERRRIARELHDETGQALNTMVFGLKAAEMALESDLGRAKEVIARLKAAASDNVRELQGIIYDLRPSVLDDLGLIPALRWFVESRLEAAGLEVKWEVAGRERRLEPEVETALFRIGQEALSNVLRHAGARHVTLGLNSSWRSVILYVSDDGKGFDVETMLSHRDESGRGLGLLGMKERVELLGGDFSVESEPGKGTTVRAGVPLAENEAKS